MQNIILLCGFGGSGKTVCARLLREKLDNVAIFGADDLFRMKPFEAQTEEGRAKIGRVKLRNSIAVLQTFIEEDCHDIIIDGLVWSQGELDAVSEVAKNTHCMVWCFWLSTSKSIRHNRAVTRGRDEADCQEFLDLIEEKIKDPTPLSISNGHYYEIETDGMNIEEVVDNILKFMNMNS